VSQLLTLYITPVIYVYLDHLGTRLGRSRWFSGPSARSGAAPSPMPAE